MSHLPFALLAYFLNALAVLSNKFLLQNTITDPLVYVFYISLVSLLAILALPFTNTPSLAVFTTASWSTVLWTSGAYFMYKALKIGQVSRVIPIIGTLIPLTLLVFASQTDTLSSIQTLAIVLLVLGMVFLTLTDWQGKFNKWELVFEALSALFFAVSYLVLREAYQGGDFFSVIVWSRLILLPLAVLILLIPNLRKKIFTSTAALANQPSLSSRRMPGSINFLSKDGLIFAGGQISGTASELLLLFSISLANPALVNSLQGTQYIFLLVFSLLLSKKYPAVFTEKYSLVSLGPKFFGIILIGTGLYLLAR